MKNEIVKKETVYTGRIIRLEKDTLRGGRGEYFREIVRHPGAVAVVPFASADEIFLIRQYRYALDKVIYEIPAGTIEAGEDSEACARREIEEELGLKAGRLEKLFCIHPSPGVMDEKIVIFKASDFEPGSQNLDDDEELTIEKMPFEGAVDLIRRGAISDAKTIAALLYIKEFGT